MSFILDALKKSESDRQQQTPATFATVPSSEDGPRAPRWLWVLGGLLAINLVVLLSLVMRSGDAPSDVPVSTDDAAASETPAQAVANFAEQIEAARLNEARRQALPASPATEEQIQAETVTATRPVAEINRPTSTQPAAKSTASLPTIFELQANGTLTLPELHLDIHVYNDSPDDRFVFINMSKHREKSQLAEGPVIKEITPDGVVLEHSGSTFLLPRD
jgi:general secretion pathway protein B